MIGKYFNVASIEAAPTQRQGRCKREKKGSVFRM